MKLKEFIKKINRKIFNSNSLNLIKDIKSFRGLNVINLSKSTQKKFTLVELIIVIIVIGILVGMALPKFIGVTKDAKVAALIRDMDVIEKGIMTYNNRSNNGEDYPFVDKTTYSTGDRYKLVDINELDKELIHTLTVNKQLEENDKIYEVDLNKLYENDVQRIKNKHLTYYYALASELLFINEPFEDENGYKVYGKNITSKDFIDLTVPQSTLWGRLRIKPEETYSPKVTTEKWGDFSIDDSKTYSPDYTTTKWNENIVSIDQLRGHANLFDGNTNTYTQAGTVEFLEDLTGKTLIINSKANYSDKSNTFYILDENDNRLSFFNLTNNKYSNSLEVRTSSTTHIAHIIIPPNAKKLTWDATKSYLYPSEIKVLNNTEDNIISNIKNVSDFQSNRLTWDASANIKGYFIMYDNKFVTYITTNYYSFAYNENAQEQKITIIPVNKDNVTNYIYDIEMEDSNVYLKGPAALFDDNTNTYSQSGTVEFLEDLTGKTLIINSKANYSDKSNTFYILDENDNRLSFFNLTNNKYSNSLEVRTSSTTHIAHIIIPPNAKKLTWDATKSYLYPSEIKVLNTNEDNEITNVKSTTSLQSNKLTWEKSDNIKGYFIMYDNKFVTYTTNNYYSFAYNENAEEQKITIIPVNKNNVTNYIYNVEIEELDVYLKANSNILDNDLNTKHRNGEIEFLQDLTGKTLVLYPWHENADDTMKFTMYDKDNNIIPYYNLVNNQYSTNLTVGGYGYRGDVHIIIPPNAKKIKYQDTASFYWSQIKEVKILNKPEDIFLEDLKQEIISDTQVKVSFSNIEDIDGYFILYNDKFYKYETKNEFIVTYDNNFEKNKIDIVPIYNKNASVVYSFELLKP